MAIVERLIQAIWLHHGFSSLLLVSPLLGPPRRARVPRVGDDVEGVVRRATSLFSTTRPKVGGKVPIKPPRMPSLAKGGALPEGSAVGGLLCSFSGNWGGSLGGLLGARAISQRLHDRVHRKLSFDFNSQVDSDS